MAENISDATGIDLLTPRLKDLQVWNDLITSFHEVMDSNVEQPIKQLENLRDLSRNADRQSLVETCRLLGFDITQDVLNISVENVLALAGQLGQYPDNNGTENFVKFLSLMMNALVGIDYLYTWNYRDFYPKPYGELVMNGGSWYKTTHVDLGIELASLAGLYLKPGQKLDQRVKEIFYDEAPVTLVIHNLYFDIRLPTSFGLAIAMGPTEFVYRLESGVMQAGVRMGAKQAGSERVYTLSNT